MSPVSPHTDALTERPYGSWRSPLTLDTLVAGALRLGEIALEGGDIYWIEGRPQEGGRNVLMRRARDRGTYDLTPAPFNVRTTVHEYGGGAFLVEGGRAYFSNFEDQQIYRVEPGARPLAITRHPGLRFADGVFDRSRERLILITEDHRGGADAVASIVGLGLSGAGELTTLAQGYDFYSSPRLSGAGPRLAWLCWNHPNMPWDGTELWVAPVREDGSLGERTRVAGGGSESIFQPEWSPDGALHFVSDRGGWWNLYRWRDGRIEALTEMEAEFGRPQWVFGNPTYAFVAADRIACSFSQNGRWRLALLDLNTRRLERVETPYSEIKELHAAGRQLVFLGGSPTELFSVVRFELDTGKRQVLARSSAAAIDPGYLSIPEPIEFPTAGGRTAHGLFYSPRNRDFRAPAGERPPLLVVSHGGPTGAAESVLDLQIQFWTSRGIAVLDVNYGGSSGYGRAYRERLKGQWGVVDVEDCAAGARYLAEAGRADGARLAIRGGSAGGYTTLCALTFTQQFRVGASYYGISDLERMAQETHKFESRYLDTLIGPYPERRELYRRRSPIHFAERISSPVIFFQGLEDKVVPPEQAERMVEALRARGLPVAYVRFAGEQHGLRRAESIRRARECELYFYSRILGFEPADPLTPVPIENLQL